MRIAVLGGRFDPPHVGHLHMARYILREGPNIDEVWMLPANTHPWRPIVASGADRLAMVKSMEEPGIRASDVDIARGGETYTIDTVKALTHNSHHTYFWICGIDQLPDLHRWKDYHLLTELVHFLIFPREGYLQQSPLPENSTLIGQPFVPNAVSSSQIRQLIKERKSISGLVTPKVEQYIKEHGLYRK